MRTNLTKEELYTQILLFIQQNPKTTCRTLMNHFHVGYPKLKQILEDAAEQNLVVKVKANNGYGYSVKSDVTEGNLKTSSNKELKIQDSIYDLLLKYGKTICPSNLVKKWGTNAICEELKRNGIDCILEHGTVDKMGWYLSIR